jgi:hypothetical protein
MKDAISRNTEFLVDEGCFLFRLNGGVDVKTEPSCDMDCGDTNAASRNMDQYRLPLPGLRFLKRSYEHCAVDGRHGGSILRGTFFWNLDAKIARPEEILNYNSRSYV